VIKAFIASWQLPLLSPRAWDMVGFALRTWLTAMLALYVSFVFQLESAYWTLLAVWILAQPTPGMMLSKSLYFALGTVVGAFLGIVLIALFSQTPELFVLALALLVAASTVASNILTNFRAYGTVLIGYTAGIVAAGAISAPDHVFFIGMARGAAILTGVGCSIFVNLIFAPQRSEALTREKLRAVLKDAAHRAGYSWKADNEVRLQIGRKLIFDLIALNTLIEYAAAESGAFRLLANQARSLLAHIFSLISARRSLDAHLIRCGWPEHEALEVFHTVILDFLNEMPGQLDQGKVDDLLLSLGEMQLQLERLQPEEEAGSSEELVSKRFVIDRMDDLLYHLERALKDWCDILHGNWKKTPTLSLNFHRDLRAAWINGLRAFIAVNAMGAFWIASAWERGPLALVFVAVLISLFSAQPHPDQVGWNFLKAGFLAAILGLICKFFVLSTGSGFEYLTFALGLFFIPLALVMANPSMAAPALSFAFVFCYVVQPANPTVYNLSESLNIALAVMMGIFFGTLSYVLIFPPNPQAARRYVTYRIRRGLEEIARLNPIPSFSFWETRMYDRVIRLYDPQNPSGTSTNEWLEAGLGSITLGNEILRLRHWLETEIHSHELKTILQNVIAAFGCFFSKPQYAVAEVKDNIRKMAQLDPGCGQPERRCWARLLGALEEIDVYLARHPKLVTIESAINKSIAHGTEEPEATHV
jgi:uncharacterized membrane protein YccC